MIEDRLRKAVKEAPKKIAFIMGHTESDTTEQLSTHTFNAMAMELGKFTRYVGLSLCLQVKNSCFLLVDFLFCFLSTLISFYDRIW